MLIKNARIKNFRCHKDLTIEFCRFHAIVGENATGKTAILEAVVPRLNCRQFVEQWNPAIIQRESSPLRVSTS
jgi:predicted ATP-dependent endonuclease of OLD family